MIYFFFWEIKKVHEELILHLPSNPSQIKKDFISQWESAGFLNLIALWTLDFQVCCDTGQWKIT